MTLDALEAEVRALKVRVLDLEQRIDPAPTYHPTIAGLHRAPHDPLCVNMDLHRVLDDCARAP